MHGWGFRAHVVRTILDVVLSYQTTFKHLYSVHAFKFVDKRKTENAYACREIRLINFFESNIIN